MSHDRKPRDDCRVSLDLQVSLLMDEPDTRRIAIEGHQGLLAFR
jgi:hypothetical protein